MYHGKPFVGGSTVKNFPNLSSYGKQILKTSNHIKTCKIGNTVKSDVKMMLRSLLQDREKKVEKSDLIDVEETSALLKISKSTLYKMSSANTVPIKT